MNRSVLRILDANANRAREALRVIEDYARFVLDDNRLSSSLKQFRHDLAASIEPFAADAILHRDTPGDVGTDAKTASELRRDDMAHVVTAAGKRLGEALRTLEEYSKTTDPGAGATLERLRYGFYDIEQQIAQTLRSPAAREFASVRLYVLLTQSACTKPWLQVAEEAILGGADCLQLREKDLESRELLHRATQLVALCRRHNVISIINDRPDIALLSGADGVHVGQADLPAREVRKLLGARGTVGVSTHNLEQAKQAMLDGADYIGVGPLFKSATKPRDFIAGLEFARAAADWGRIPAVAIAGITLENVDEVLATGIKAIAVTAAVVGAADPRAAAAGFKEELVAVEERGPGR